MSVVTPDWLCDGGDRPLQIVGSAALGQQHHRVVGDGGHQLTQMLESAVFGAEVSVGSFFLFFVTTGLIPE